jgi:hypothetical protein
MTIGLLVRYTNLHAHAIALVIFFYEKGEVDNAGDNAVEECSRVPGELKSVLGNQGTLISLRLPRNFGQP